MEAYARRLEAKMRTIDDLEHQLRENGLAQRPKKHKRTSSGGGVSTTTGVPSASLQAPESQVDLGPMEPSELAMTVPRQVEPRRRMDSHDNDEPINDHNQHRQTAQQSINNERGPRHQLHEPRSIGEKIADIERYADFLSTKHDGNNGRNIKDDVIDLQSQLQQMYDNDTGDAGDDSDEESRFGHLRDVVADIDSRGTSRGEFAQDSRGARISKHHPRMTQSQRGRFQHSRDQTRLYNEPTMASMARRMNKGSNARRKRRDWR